MKTLYPLEHPFITVDLYFIAADNMQAKLTDADAILLVGRGPQE
jgi:hypothetical protein